MMAAELVNSATSDKLTEMDWMKNIEICELVAQDQRQAKDVIKAIKKRLGNKNSNTQLFAVTLLETLMNNIGENVYKQVIDSGLLPLLVKIVKKKSEMSVREKIFLLLDATQTFLGGASGKFPQYYTAYYDLVSAGVEFSHSPAIMVPNTEPQSHRTSSTVVKKCSPSGEPDPPKLEVDTKKNVPESSIILKASNVLEVLREVLDAVDPQSYEAAKDEFTLDLVEQCSFQKQRVMHLVISSRDEKLVARAISLNEQLEKVLARHDALISGRTTSVPNNNILDEAEEEEVEQLLRRIRKGKACARPQDDKRIAEQSMGLHGSSVPGERLHRPLIRPLSIDLSHESRAPPPSAVVIPPPPSAVVIPPPFPAAVVIPPPPAKYVERERFFQEKDHKGDSTNALAGHVRNLSLHSRNGSSSNSYSGSTDSN